MYLKYKYRQICTLGKIELNMQNKNDYFKMLILWNEFLYYIDVLNNYLKHVNSYNSLALKIIIF
jgi:hypothetical protein